MTQSSKKQFQRLFIISSILIFSTVINISCQNRQRRNLVPKNENYITGKIIHIIDGDTYDILIEGNKTVRVRMNGIDAPEKGMPFYQVSKKYLKDLCIQKTVKFKQTDTDHHGRIIGFTYLDDGRELSHEMIKAGFAWHYKEHNSDKDLADLEIKAQNEKKGLWKDNNPLPPWEVRKLHRQGISTKDQFKDNPNK